MRRGAITPSMHLFHSATDRCGNCGREHRNRGVFVIDARVDFLCRSCADSYDFTDGFARASVTQAPGLIVYVRNGSSAVGWWVQRRILKINFSIDS